MMENSKEKNAEEAKLVALIRIRGEVGVTKTIKDTLNILKLYKKNFCTVHKAVPSTMGMIKKAKDYITWGEISEEVLKELIDKRGEPNPQDSKRTKPFFRLHPPRGGYGRKGVKQPFSVGGALGCRGDKINDLIRKMI